MFLCQWCSMFFMSRTPQNYSVFGPTDLKIRCYRDPWHSRSLQIYYFPIVKYNMLKASKQKVTNRWRFICHMKKKKRCYSFSCWSVRNFSGYNLLGQGHIYTLSSHSLALHLTHRRHSCRSTRGGWTSCPPWWTARIPPFCPGHARPGPPCTCGTWIKNSERQGHN